MVRSPRLISDHRAPTAPDHGAHQDIRTLTEIVAALSERVELLEARESLHRPFVHNAPQG